MNEHNYSHDDKKNKTVAEVSAVHDLSNLYESEIIEEYFDALMQETDWLKKIISARIKEHQNEYIENENLPYNKSLRIYEIEPLPEIPDTSYFDFITANEFNYIERLILVLAFAAEYEPGIFNSMSDEALLLNNGFHPYGGIKHVSGRFFPTLQTVIFLLSGQDSKLNSEYKRQLKEHHPLFRKQIINLASLENDNFPLADPMISLNQIYIDYFLTGQLPRLDYGRDFPAKLLETKKALDHLIVDDTISSSLESIMRFIKYHHDFFSDEDTEMLFQPGYIVIFYGPPGTGKSITPAILGKECGVPVYKIDLSSVISKFIGETEKNLERVFARLEDKNVILFFDEADALFGKRTEIMDAKDRYANQEVNYLLQRIEKWNGVVILATNFRQNFDDAFRRRIIKEVHFTPPKTPELVRLWKLYLPKRFTYNPVDLPDKLARMYPFTGANISSVLKCAGIDALANGTTEITKDILNPIIRDECSRNKLHQTYRPL